MTSRGLAKPLSRIAAMMLFATSVVLAQAPKTPPQAPKTPPQTGKQQDQRPTYAARTDYISTDVRVTDRNGMFIPGLTKNDFEVYEDGRLQTIQTFMPYIGGRALPTFVGSMAPPASEGIILPAPAKRNDTNGRFFIIFIDDMHLQPSDSPIVRQWLGTIRDELLKENDIIGMVSTGFSSIEVNPVYDPQHKRFNAAIEKVMGSADTPHEIINLPITAGGIQRLRYNANVAFKTAYSMLEQAAQIKDRRKAFIYVSSGYHFNPFKDSRYERVKDLFTLPTPIGSDQQRPGQGGGDDNNNSDRMPRLPGENPFDYQGTELSEMDLISELAYLTLEARRANVVFYPVDPRGLQAGPNIADRLTYHEWRDWVTVTTSSLHILGNQTGGFCICEKNDPRPGLQRIDAEMSDYYVIGYATSNPDPMKLHRRIEIKIPKHPDARLVYTPEYVLPKTPRNR